MNMLMIMSDIPDIIRQKNIFVGLILLLFSELKREQKKAEKKDNLKEVAQICNCIGELLAKYGMFNI